MGDNYYEVLGVSRGASADEIKRGYRSLARELHPDVRPDDAAAAERFKRVSEAWAVLSDPEKRARYDKFGGDGLREGFDPDAWSRARSGAGGRRVDMNDLGDLFGSAGFGGFGGFAGPRGGARRGEDLSYRLDVSFDDAVRGFQTRFDYRQPVSCTACSGAGFTAGGACGSCRGRGTVEKTRTVNVNVPKGASTGDRIRLKKRGGAGRGGAPAGDVVIELQVEDDSRFRREGQNLVVVARVDAVDVLLGTRVEVESLDGPIRVQVPANVRSGSRLRVRARGIERGQTRGDLFVEVFVDGLTQPLTAECREHVLALRRALGRDSGSETTQVSGARSRGAEDEDAATGENSSQSQAFTK